MVDEARRVGGIVLAVTVQRHHDRRPRRQHAGAHRAALARVLGVEEQAQGRDLRRQRPKRGAGAVAAGVVDEDQLIGAAGEGGGDLARQVRRGAFFIEDRDDY